jgi:carbon-monoxide dehydrogenase medium subunit
MRPFEYVEPAVLDEVLGLLAQRDPGTHLVAGGTALVLLMKLGLVEPRRVVSLRRLAGLDGVRPGLDGGIEIGGLATHRAAETSRALRAYDAALAGTFGQVATVRIRNQATVGGNIVHADPAQDPPPMLMVLGADVVLRASDGERVVPLADLFVDYMETVVRGDEVLTAVRMPARPAGLRTVYLKYLPRSVDDYATVSVAAGIELDPEGRVRDARIALGAAGPVPFRAREAEASLLGGALRTDAIRQAAALARAAADPLDDVRGSAAYKRQMVEVWVRRALERLGGEGVEARA